MKNAKHKNSSNQSSQKKKTILQKPLHSKTERKRRKILLQRLATVVHDSNDTITLQDKDGNIFAWNRGAEQMYGYTETEALKMNIQDIVPNQKKKEALDFIKNIFQGKFVESFETQRLTNDGKLLDVWLTVTILKDDKGNPEYVATTERDITERKRAEEELDKYRRHLEELVKKRTAELIAANTQLKKEIAERKRAEKEIKTKQKELEELNVNLENRVQEELEKSRQKDYIMIQQSRLAAMGEMIRYIIHQWGQPLWALQLLFHNIESLLESIGIENDDSDNLVATGLKLVERMFATMDDFKSFFQADKEKVNFSINKNIKDTLSLVGASFKYINIPITIDEKEELMVSGFPNEFSHVILNFLKNAKDAIIEKGINGEITIDLLREGDSAIVRIKDNGGGIPEAILDKIFDSYFSTKTEGIAVGIGLYMSKVIIKEHMNGRINVKNTADGAEFEIILPMIQSS